MTNENSKQDAEYFGERSVWKVTINAPIETVWNTLVKTDDVLPFFFGSVCETRDGLKPGGKMRMVSKDRKYAVVFGEVLEFSPPYRYSHTMSFTQVEGERPAKTTYELKEVPSGTEFTLTSECIPGTKTGKMIEGGQFIVDNLKAVVETGKPRFSGAMVMALGPLMGLFTPKRSRIENWPLEAEK
ncbi:MAG: SRPBCC domain-containing protein [Amphiplicatus sp.]